MCKCGRKSCPAALTGTLVISGQVIAVERDEERDYLVARIPIAIAGPDRVFRTVEADVDTGFTGWLTLPTAIIQDLGLVSHGRRLTVMANNEARRSYLYRVLLAWHGVLRWTTVIQSEDQPLIGMALLSDCRLTVDAWEGGPVVIAERPR